MAPESVSFRITRNTEDLVQTIHALSHRLVTLEQKLDAMQLQLNHRLIEESSPDPRAVASLDTVERLLHDCRCLLGLDGSDQPQSALDAFPLEPFPSEPLQRDSIQLQQRGPEPSAAASIEVDRVVELADGHGTPEFTFPLDGAAGEDAPDGLMAEAFRRAA